MAQLDSDIYYVYIAKAFDTPFSVASRFGLTSKQLAAANPQWKGRVIVYFRIGEEINMPDGYQNSYMFSLFRAGLLARNRKTPAQKLAQKPSYAPDWFPPEPKFGSPSASIKKLMEKLGNPKYRVDKPGQYHSPITFTDGWDRRNISLVEIPQLKGVPFYSLGNTQKCSGKISFYTKAHQAIQKLFKAWEDDGLIPKILTLEGSFNPRVIKSTSTPSNHSFGTAFDINGTWNGETKKPAGIGKQGCLLELVPRASELGFYWGGFYKDNIDGMHFEYANL